MRDLATYESNFSESSGIRSVLMKIHKMVMGVKEKVKKKPGDEEDDWMSSKLKNKVSENFKELTYLKNEIGSVIEV
jgi:hypothetical protein